MTRPGYIKVANDVGATEQAVELAEGSYLAGIGLYVLCLGYCDRQRTDGHVPRRALSRVIAPGLECSEVVAELERVGLLQAAPDGWTIPGYLDWQRSRDQIEGASEAARNAARSRWGKARGSAEGNADRIAEGNAPNQPTIGTNQPSIHPPVLVATAEETEATLSDGSPQLAGEFEDWWSEYGRIGDKARAFDLYRWWRTTGQTQADELLTAAVCYREHCAATACLMKHGTTFLAKPAKGKSPVWPEWAAGEEHGAMDVGAASHLNDVLTAGALAFGLTGGNHGNGPHVLGRDGRRVFEQGRSTAASGGRADARRSLPPRELEVGQ